jgi:hypothetical protein
MSSRLRAALTPEQWDARDYRQKASELDEWAQSAARPIQDSTEFVAKLGLDENGCVIVMNRAHDRALIPPPARAALAALALIDQPFGLTRNDIEMLRAAAEASRDGGISGALRDLAARLQGLLPPEPSGSPA